MRCRPLAKFCRKVPRFADGGMLEHRRLPVRLTPCAIGHFFLFGGWGQVFADNQALTIMSRRFESAARSPRRSTVPVIHRAKSDGAKSDSGNHSPIRLKTGARLAAQGATAIDSKLHFFTTASYEPSVWIRLNAAARASCREPSFFRVAMPVRKALVCGLASLSTPGFSLL